MSGVARVLQASAGEARPSTGCESVAGNAGDIDFPRPLWMCYCRPQAMLNDLRPMCFIAMPFGVRTADGGMAIDFDRVHEYIHRGAEAAGLEAIRADVEPAGGFVHKPMLERLLVAEYVI